MAEALLDMLITGSDAGDVAVHAAQTGYHETARASVVEFPGCALGGDWVLMEMHLSGKA